MVMQENKEPRKNRMPVEAIANENWIGRLPTTLTRTTKNVVSLMQPYIYLSTIFGSGTENQRKNIKYHHYVLKNSEPVLHQVPANIGSTFHFSFVGAWTPQEISEQKTRYAAQDCMFDLLKFFELHHQGYKDNVFSDQSLSGDFPVNEKLCRLMQHSAYNTGTAETAVEDSTVHYVFSPTSNHVIASPLPRKLQHIGLFFPTLLPFGEGGPVCQQVRHLSVNRWIKRCLKLHGGVFGRHWGFTAIAYDYTALEQSYSQQYLTMRVCASAISDGKWTKEDIQKCYNHSCQMEECLKRSVTLPEAPQEVKQLMDIKKAILPGLRAFVGSDKSHQAGLHTAFGLQCRLGVANIFATISPATSRSWAVAINCDPVNGEHCQLKVLVADGELAMPGTDGIILPNNNARASAASANSYECADYACRVLNVFLEDFIVSSSGLL
ncbi:hypothetical protein BDR26DRAFT_971962 [Obelidium mucronatum]|nr:hypothetical protein BDR26DRAFT_971962 [Obelidium mucronatum]